MDAKVFNSYMDMCTVYKIKPTVSDILQIKNLSNKYKGIKNYFLFRKWEEEFEN